MPTLNLDEAKNRLQGLKARADKLLAKKEGLQRNLTIQEQNQARALQELADLGYPQVKDLDPQQLQAFNAQLGNDLSKGLDELETAVAATEGLMGISQGNSLEID